MATLVVIDAGFSASAEPNWPTASKDYVVVDQDLRAVLQQFAVNTGLRLALSDKVQGRVGFRQAC